MIQSESEWGNYLKNVFFKIFEILGTVSQRVVLSRSKNIILHLVWQKFLRGESGVADQ